jgi:hypothetical protein
MSKLAMVWAFLLASAFVQAQQGWKMVHQKDEMTDKVIEFAATTSGNSPDVVLGVGCVSGKVKVVISGPSLRPALDGRYDCNFCGFSRWYMHYQTNVHLRFDSQKATGTKIWIQENPQTLVAWQAPADKDLVRKLMDAHRFLVQYNTLGGGTEVLEFDVSGLHEAIQQVPECVVDIGLSPSSPGPGSPQSTPATSRPQPALSATEPADAVVAPPDSAVTAAGTSMAIPAKPAVASPVAPTLAVAPDQLSTAAPAASPETISKGQAAAAPAEQANVEFWSDPAGADIEVDGKHVGTTPSTLMVPPGWHTVTMRKQDFRSWQKTIDVTSGSLRVAAYLQQVAVTLQ